MPTQPPAKQMTFFGTWEEAQREPLPQAEEQTELFEGPISLKREAEAALISLSPQGLRAAHERARAAFPKWDGATRWPRYADTLEGIVGKDDEAAEGLVLRAVSLLQGAKLAQLFVGLAPGKQQGVRASLLAQAARRYQEENGAAALLPKGAGSWAGRPSSVLYLLGGKPVEAVAALQLARSCGDTSAMTLGYLGESLWRSGRTQEAVVAYRDAYLLAALAERVEIQKECLEQIDEREMTCRPIMDLLDLAAEFSFPEGEDERVYLPVLGDLKGMVPLPTELPPQEPGTRAGLTLRALHRFRLAQKEEQAPAIKLEHKKEVLTLAPYLRALVQPLS